jgi:hypothetical protein
MQGRFRVGYSLRHDLSACAIGGANQGALGLIPKSSIPVPNPP